MKDNDSIFKFSQKFRTILNFLVPFALIYVALKIIVGAFYYFGVSLDFGYFYMFTAVLYILIRMYLKYKQSNKSINN